MRKSIIWVWLFIVIGIVFINIDADKTNAAVSGDYEYTVLKDGTIEINNYLGGASEVIVPSKIGNRYVTIIGQASFQDKQSIVTLTLSEGIEKIDFVAITSCDSLEAISIPKSVNYISSEAFNFNPSLKSVNVDPNNKMFISLDGVLFTKDKTILKYYPAGKMDNYYQMPDSVSYIDTAFGDNYYLESITFSKNLKRIGMYAFASCNGLTSVTFPEGTEIIEDWAFIGCQNLIEINIPSSVNNLGDAFIRCSKLSSINVDSDNKKYSSIDGVLLSKSQETLIKYPSAKTEVMFRIPSSVKKISYGAFNGLSYCNTIEISENVSSIMDDSFNDYCSVSNIIVDKNNKYYSSDDGVLFNKNKTKIIYYPGGKTATTYSIPDGVVEIGYSAFNSCTLQNVKIPYSVKIIGPSAFKYAHELQKVKIPYTVKEIGCDAFWNCTNLIILCVKDTFAYNYAISYEYKYETYIDDTMPHLSDTKVELYTEGEPVIIKLLNSSDSKVVWKTDNSDIVKVSNGKLTPAKKGSATVTAVCDGVTYICKVIVKKPSISAMKLTLEVGETSTLFINGISKNIVWSSSNKNIATVDKKGVVTALKSGETTITAKTKNQVFKTQIIVNENFSEYLLKYQKIKLWIENETSNADRYATATVTNSYFKPVILTGDAVMYNSKGDIEERRVIYLYVAPGTNYEARLGILPGNINSITCENISCNLSEDVDKKYIPFQVTDIVYQIDTSNISYDESKNEVVVPYTVSNNSNCDVSCIHSIKIFNGDNVLFDATLNDYCVAGSTYNGEITITSQNNITPKELSVDSSVKGIALIIY